MDGSDEENETLFHRVVTEGDKGMVPSFINVIRRINSMDLTKGNNLPELFQYGEDMMKLTQQSQNMDDMIRKDRRITPEMLEEGGLSKEEYAAYEARRNDFGLATGMATSRLKAIKQGYSFSDGIFEGFDTSVPSQPPVPQAAPVPPPSLPPEAIRMPLNGPAMPPLAAPLGPAPSTPAPSPQLALPADVDAHPGGMTLPKAPVRPNQRLLDRFRRR